MAKRYDGWHHTTLRGDRVLARSHVPFGRKLLGAIAQEMETTGNGQGKRTHRADDGTVIVAQIIGAIPTLTITSPPRPPERRLVDIAGFVTWPTDENGATALPDSARVVLAGDAMRGVREGSYGGVFPEGLNRAGNVDWHGKGGWVLSWYGPRTRYIDFDTLLQPWVFFKGQPLIDVRDHVDTDAVVLGAAVTTIGGWPWLVTVVEHFNFARFEDVYAVKLRDPADLAAVPVAKAAKLEIIADTFHLIGGRTHNDFNIGRHPWCFNPTGDEARLLTEAGADYWERIIRLVEDETAEHGFLSEYEHLVVPRADVSESGGYTTGTFVQHFGQDTVVKNRVGTTDLRDLAPPPYVGPAPPPVPFGPLGYTLDTDDAIRGCLEFLEGWENRADEVVAGDLWQPIAVDYKPDGSVVYGYGHIPSSQGVDSGSATVDPGAPSTNGFFGGNATYTGEFVPSGGFWDIHVNRERGPASGSWVENYEGAALYTSSGTTTGVRVGLVELLALNDGDRTCSATIQRIRNGGTSSFFAANTIGRSDDATPVICDGMYSGGFIEAGDFAEVIEHSTVTAESHDTSTETRMFLLHMDLRYDALFIAREINDNETIITQTVDHRFVTTGGNHREHTESRSTLIRDRRRWLTEGWMHGNKVLEDDVATVDTFDTAAPVITGFTNLDYPSELLLNSYLIYTLGAFVSPSQSPPGGSSTWDLPALPAMLPYPRAPGAFYTPYEAPSRSAEVPANNLAYQLHDVTTPTAQQVLLTWALEVEAPVGEIVGATFPGDATAAKVKWHIDAEGVPLVGAWACYKGKYAYSMPLPALNTEPTPFRFASRCSVGEIAARALTEDDPPVDHFSPIWVLAPTRGFTSPLT